MEQRANRQANIPLLHSNNIEEKKKEKKRSSKQNRTL